MGLSKIVRDSLNTGIDDNSDATAITIDSSENVGIGTSTPAEPFHIKGASGAATDVQIQGGDDTNQIRLFIGGNTNRTNGRIIYNTASDYLAFSTGGDQRIRVDSDGLKFGTDTAASNALDDYDEGAWTPSIGGSATYNSGNDGRYVKVGGIVHCTFLANINSRGTGSQVRLSGLPFASQNTGFVHSGCVSYFANLNSNATFVGFYVESNATTMQFVCATGSAGPTIAGNGFSVFKDSSVVYGAVSYPTDA